MDTTEILILVVAAVCLAVMAACKSPETAEQESETTEARTSEQTEAGGGSGGSDASHEHDRHHGFDDPSAYAEEWNAEGRDDWQKPEDVIEVMGIDAGDRVADLGSGTGYFLPYLSRAVGGDGSVVALDVSQEMLDYVEQKIVPKLEHGNVEVRQVQRDDPGLGAESVNSVLTVNTWHHVKSRVAYAKKIYAALKPGGTFVDVDYTKETPEGPPREIKLTPEEVVSEFEAAGFDAQIVDETLPKQYIVVGTKPQAE